MAKINTLFMTKTAEKPHPLGHTYHIPIEPIKGSTPLRAVEQHETSATESANEFCYKRTAFHYRAPIY